MSRSDIQDDSSKISVRFSTEGKEKVGAQMAAFRPDLVES